MGRNIIVSGVSLEVEEQGQGRPILFLHPGEGLQVNRPWFNAMAADHRVIAPHHPGFGGSALPDWIGTVDDLAYLYLDVAAQFHLENAVLAGACFGGWVAAEMAVRNTARFAGLLLAAPLGIKVGGVLDRDIIDMHAIPRSEFMRLAWADPAKARSTTQDWLTPNLLPSPGGARRWRCSAGSRTCTTPVSGAGCTGSTSRPI